MAKRKPGIREGHTQTRRQPPEAQHTLNTQTADEVMTPSTDIIDAKGRPPSNLRLPTEEQLPANALGSSTYNNEGMVH